MRGALSTSAGVGVVMVAAALSQFFAMILLGRTSEAALGQVSLVLSTATVVGTFALVGQSNAFARILARGDAAQLAWPVQLRRALLESVVLSAAMGLVASWALSMSWMATGVVVVAAAGLAVSELVASGVLRPLGKFFSASLLLRFWSLALGLAVVGLFLAEGLTKDSSLLAFGAVAGVGVVLGPLALIRAPSGEEPLPSTWRRTGFMFWSIQLCLIATRHLDRLVLGGVLGEETLAKYQAVLTLLMAFDLASTALGFVLLPKLARTARVNAPRLGSMVGAVAAAGVVGYLLLAEPVLHWAYDGHFDDSAFLISWFVAAGVLKVIYALPSALLGGRTSDRALAWFAGLNVPLVVVHATLTAYLAHVDGVRGAAIALVIAWGLRLVVSIGLVWRFWEPERVS
ncbi:MAG: hypothetical protein RMA76_20830 [Deltaproteobacteria bacterium]|jgi:O-antigen/teichoic acid export membrane protein